MESTEPIPLQTLIFVMENNKVLLGMKKRDFGKGKWNGYGGKKTNGETVRACAVRELSEECNLQVNENNLNHLGHILIKKENRIARKVHIYTCYDVSGVVKETDEMKPEWFNISKIPYDEMWPDCYFWIPFVLSDTKFEGTFSLDQNDELISIHIDIKS